MGLTDVCTCVHTEVRVCHHDRGWVPTPNVRWCMVRDALAYAVWLRGYSLVLDPSPLDPLLGGDPQPVSSLPTNTRRSSAILP